MVKEIASVTTESDSVGIKGYMTYKSAKTIAVHLPKCMEKFGKMETMVATNLLEYSIFSAIFFHVFM